MQRILLVDDEDTLLKLVGTMLKNEGYDVQTANSGEAALEILENEPIDLLLLDIMMPEMDGWEVVKELKERPHIKNPYIAMLTAKTMSPHHFYGKDVEGLVDYINKPFSKQELLDRVKSIFTEDIRIKEVVEKIKETSPELVGEYEELSRLEQLHQRLLESLEYSLSKKKDDASDYGSIVDAIDYSKVLLTRISERKKMYEKIVEKS